MKAFSHKYESVHKNGDGQDSKRRTIISFSTRQPLEIPIYCCLLTETVASPAVALLFIKGEIRFNHCGEASFVMPNTAVDQRKRCIRRLEAHQGDLPLWKVTFFCPESVWKVAFKSMSVLIFPLGKCPFSGNSEWMRLLWPEATSRGGFGETLRHKRLHHCWAACTMVVCT